MRNQARCTHLVIRENMCPKWTALDTKVTMVQPPSEEFALLLEVMMADRPEHPHPPTFSLNAGMEPLCST